ncbi:caprin-2-like isoform X2 [Clarias magur]|uniref:Caprin-2-like isoform X2 n=1 Tax=Clarias magur TaxID=1594786 RepID=A0A8J4UQ09_CLAMG|nr:caprin-2-like isoform X2 [Clarias magur]
MDSGTGVSRFRAEEPRWSTSQRFPQLGMFGFHKPKMYRSLNGCCICRAKSSSSRFTDSKRYERDFQSCFGLCETRSGEICNACVLLVKRWKKLPVGSKKNWNHVVDARGGPSLKMTVKSKKVKPLSRRIRPSQICRVQNELKRNNSDAHSTTSSASPAQSPSYSNQSDEGSDSELAPGSTRSPVFSFLDLTYWRSSERLHSQQERRMREIRTMVQLFPSQGSDATVLPGSIDEAKAGPEGSPSADSPRAFTALQLALNPSGTVYHGYETYIEDGLICLKHKIRNIEKKKLKLEGYQMRLKNGEMLNRDQMDAVGRYEEVVHNLQFAKELQKTICALTQDLLKAQRKAMRKDQVQRAETEQRRLAMMLQVQYVLCSLQRHEIRKSFDTCEHARYLTAKDVEKLLNLASLIACKRDEGMSLEDQMEKASFVYLALLDGKDEPVAGSTYKCLREKLLRLVDSGLFDHLPEPKEDPKKNDDEQKPDVSSTSSTLPEVVSLNSVDMASRQFLNRRYITEGDLTGPRQGDDMKVQSPNWKVEFLAHKEQEPPDSWDMEVSDPPVSSKTGLQKPWKGAAGFIPKTMVTMKSDVETKQKRQKKIKGSQASKSNGDVKKPVSVEVFNSPSSLAKDPALRRQQLDNLMDQITGSFSFIQDSLLDGEAVLGNGRARGLCLSPVSSPLAPREPNIPTDILPPSHNSTPLHGHQCSEDPQSTLTNGDQITKASDLKINTQDESHVGKQPLSNGDIPSTVLPQSFSTPPSRRSLPATSTASFSSLHSVFSVDAPITRGSELKTDESGFLGGVCLSYSTASTLSRSTASTQTPPELSLPQDDLQMESAYLSESDISATSQVYSSPGLNSGPQSQSSLVQHYYPRNTLRGGFEVHRANVRAPGGGFSSQTHRETGSVLYTSQENGYQTSHKRTGGTAARRNSSVGWSDSSQVSSPDREGAYIIDSAHGDSLTITTSAMPLTGPPPHTLMPVYPQLRVAFSAARATNLAPGTLDQPIAFDLLHSNLGSAFDAPSGHFSCPAAGTYVFFFHILKLAISVPLYVNLMRNDEVVASAYANDGAPDHETASNHAVLPLRVGDHIWLRLHRGAIYGSSWKYSTFSGFLLYPD